MHCRSGRPEGRRRAPRPLRVSCSGTMGRTVWRPHRRSAKSPSRIDQAGRARATALATHPPMLTLLALLAQTPAAAPPSTAGAAPQATATAEVVDVVDGDTLHVLLDGQQTTLRLLSVDTEEKISARAGGSPSKPQT